MDEQIDQELTDVRPDRRAFVKRVVTATAFATPLVASFDLASLNQSVSFSSSSSNTNPPPPGPA